MQAIALGARIWFFTVLITVLLIEIVVLLFGEAELWSDVLGIFFLGTIYGLLVTSPLLIPTVLLVSTMPRIPYSLSIAAIWLWSMLAILVIIAVVSVVWIVDGRFPDVDNYVIYFIGIVLSSLLIVIMLSLSTLRKFNNTVRSKRLQQDVMA